MDLEFIRRVNERISHRTKTGEYYHFDVDEEMDNDFDNYVWSSVLSDQKQQHLHVIFQN